MSAPAWSERLRLRLRRSDTWRRWRKTWRQHRDAQTQDPPPAAGWIFVLGVNNSGTTVLQRVLNGVEGLRGLPREGQHLSPARPAPMHLGVIRCWTRRLDVFRRTEHDAGPHERELARQLARDWRRHAAPGSGPIVEKSPPHTVAARWFQHHFPESGFIAIVRHPFAVCDGIHRRTPRSLFEAARHWRIANRILLDDLPWLQRRVLIRYEDFCARRPACLAALNRVLPVPLRDEHLASLRYAANIEDRDAPLRDFNRASFDRLGPEERAGIAAEVGDLAPLLGYRCGLEEPVGTPASPLVEGWGER